MKNPDISLLERVSDEATKSILAEHGGMAPFDAPALIIRPKFENHPYADEPLRIIGKAVRMALATVLRDSATVPTHLDRFFAGACRRVFDRLKMAPVLNYTQDNPSAGDNNSGHFFQDGFSTLDELGITTEIGVPVNRLIPFISEQDTPIEKMLVYPKIHGMRQLRELQESLPEDNESHQLRTLIAYIINTFIDFTQKALHLTTQNDIDDADYRTSMTTLRLDFLSQISRYYQDIRCGEFFDPECEHTVILGYIQTRLSEILQEAKQYITSSK